MVPSITSGAKEAQGEEDEGTVMILDTSCTEAMCSRHSYHYVKHGLSDGQVELLPDSGTFLTSPTVKEPWRVRKRRTWFSYEPPLFTDFSVIDEGGSLSHVPSADEEPGCFPGPVWNA